MSEDDTLRRIEKLEAEIERLCNTISELNLTIVVLNKTVESMSAAEKRRAELRDKSVLFIIGGFISAAVVWIINGGLIK
jgi:prefoldin subunit 5